MAQMFGQRDCPLLATRHSDGLKPLGVEVVMAYEATYQLGTSYRVAGKTRSPMVTDSACNLVSFNVRS